MTSTSAVLHSLELDDGRLSAVLRLAGEELTIAYGLPIQPERTGYEPFVVAALPLAMRFASALEVPEPVSPRLLSRLPDAQAMLARWAPGLREVSVEAEPGDGSGAPAPGGGTATFFTGGIDSLYTAIRERDSLDALVYVHGLELRVDTERRHRIVSERLHRAADALGVELLEVETDLRARVSEPRVGWGMYHGAALASVALALDVYGRMLVPATQPPGQVEPWGSHPSLDGLWSTERVEIVHEGEATRIDKLALISEHQFALDVLRVCLAGGSDYNCGRCTKCVNAAAALETLGALDRCPTLPHRISLRRLALQPIDEIAVASVERAYELARARRRWAIAAAIRTRLAVGPRLRELSERPPGRLRRAWARARRGLRR